VIAEAGELCDPEGFDFVEPAAEFSEGFVAELVDADAGVGFDALFGDEAGAAEDAEVAAHGLGAEVQRGGDFAGATGFAVEQVDDGAAGIVGEGGEGGVDHCR